MIVFFVVDIVDFYFGLIVFGVVCGVDEYGLVVMIVIIECDLVWEVWIVWVLCG